MTSVTQNAPLVKGHASPHAPETQSPTAITRQQETMRGLPHPDILELIDQGFSIIPIERGTKRPPEGFQWRRYQEQAATREQVEQWQREYPGCNWAAVWGKASGNVIAVDIDSPAAFGWCQKQGGFNQRWPVWYATGRVRKITAPGGIELTDWSTETAWQYIFRLPEELADVRGVNPHSGVEIRCNGQISVLPPSIHPSGKAYEWKRFGEIPFVPDWVLGWLYGHPTIRQQGYTRDNPTGRRDRGPMKAGSTAAASATTQKTAVQAPPQRRDPLRPQLMGNNPRILENRGWEWLWSTTFPEGSRNSAFFSLAILLRAAGIDQEEATRKLDQWRYKCTKPVYNEREASAVIKTTYRISYGVTVAGLRKAIDVNGERMPERYAIELARLLPNLRRKRGQRIHEPIFVSVGRVLEVLYKQRALKPTTITHERMAKLAGISADRVRKVAGFLDEIGVRTTTRQRRSTTSSYNLKGLNVPASQLIKHLARWRGYSVPWRVIASRLWRRVHSLMRAVLSHLNNLWSWIVDTWQGESGKGEGALHRVALEGVSGRAPPN